MNKEALKVFNVLKREHQISKKEHEEGKFTVLSVDEFIKFIKDNSKKPKKNK